MAAPNTPAPVPGSDPNPGAAFDAEAFKADILGEFNKGLNGFAASLKKDVAKMLEAKPPETPAPDPAPQPDPEPKESKTVAELNLRLGQIEKSNKALQDQVTLAQKQTEEERTGKLEAERVAAVDKVLADIPFATPKARAQFRAAYQGQVKRDDDGNFIVETDKGPVGADMYLKSEAEESPHFLAPEGSGGAGANGGVRPRKEQPLDILNMSPADYYKLTPDQQTAMRQQNLKLAMSNT